MQPKRFVRCRMAKEDSPAGKEARSIAHARLDQMRVMADEAYRRRSQKEVFTAEWKGQDVGEDRAC